MWPNIDGFVHAILMEPSIAEVVSTSTTDGRYHTWLIDPSQQDEIWQSIFISGHGHRERYFKGCTMAFCLKGMFLSATIETLEE